MVMIWSEGEGRFDEYFECEDEEYSNRRIVLPEESWFLCVAVLRG